MKFFAKNIFRAAGFGLLEIIIAMLISSTILLASVSVAARGYSLVKESELRDTASGILIRSLELSRSPFDLNLRGEFNVTKDENGRIVGGSPGIRVYALSRNTEGALELSSVDRPVSNIPSSAADFPCSAGSSGPERVKLEEVVTDVTICNLVYINYVGASASGKEAVFRIVSAIVFLYGVNSNFDSLVTYRSELV